MSAVVELFYPLLYRSRAVSLHCRKNRRVFQFICKNAFIAKLLTLTLYVFSLSDEKLDLNDSKWEDIHVITGALKMFFRELPEPLFTYNHFNDFVNAISKSGKPVCA